MENRPVVAFGASTDVGLMRNENQDAYGVFAASPDEHTSHKGQLFVVADGMGGHKGGKQASELAVKIIGETYSADADKSVLESLANALQAANEAVYRASLRSSALSGMGTTCVALVVRGNHVHVAHIGDSRVYRVTKAEIIQLTRDHTAVAEMQRRGIITAEEAKYHPERSVLYRALGTESVAEIEVQPEIVVTATEWFVLCSDGLTNMVEDADIQDVVISHPPQEACETLVGLANERGGVDNITVIVVQISEP
ncbi:MAG: Stp1/IreP family PP2C-type Ser/Thr phosphatase [Bacteroidota bacterium]